VISVGALTPILVCFHKPEITPLSNSNHSRDGTLALAGMFCGKVEFAAFFKGASA
jgi:hypothetical protein